MVINNSGSDPTHGTGPEKVTESVTPESGTGTGDARPGAGDPERGGCLKLGWGCLPVVAVGMLLPIGLFF